MNLYEVSEIERKIEQIAILNEGEIDDASLQQLVEAQTSSLIQIENLVHYIKSLEYLQATAKMEEQRISDIRKRADARVESIKKYLTPYVESKGKIQVGTFTLSTRKSESVDANIDELPAQYINVKESYSVDKVKIKDDIKKGIAVHGAVLKQNNNLIIK